MKILHGTILAISMGVLAAASEDALADAQSCRDLAGLSLSALNDAPSQITGTRFVPAGDGLPAFCDVIGYTAAQVGWQVRLPGKLERLLPHGRLRHFVRCAHDRERR